MRLAIAPGMFTIADKRKDMADALTPPPWKMMIASALAIYPLIYFLPPALEPYTEDLPTWLATLAQVALLTPLSTLVMIPAASWALKRWLYKPQPRA